MPSGFRTCPCRAGPRRSRRARILPASRPDRKRRGGKRRRFPGDRLWFRHRWVLIGIRAAGSAGLLAVIIAGAMPVMRTFAILLNVYLALLAALPAFSQRAKGR